jgi:hypothetical protein
LAEAPAKMGAHVKENEIDDRISRAQSQIFSPSLKAGEIKRRSKTNIFQVYLQ